MQLAMHWIDKDVEKGSTVTASSSISLRMAIAKSQYILPDGYVCHDVT